MASDEGFNSANRGSGTVPGTDSDSFYDVASAYVEGAWDTAQEFGHELGATVREGMKQGGETVREGIGAGSDAAQSAAISFLGANAFSLIGAAGVAYVAYQTGALKAAAKAIAKLSKTLL